MNNKEKIEVIKNVRIIRTDITNLLMALNESLEISENDVKLIEQLYKNTNEVVGKVLYNIPAQF